MWENFNFLDFVQGIVNTILSSFSVILPPLDTSGFYSSNIQPIALWISSGLAPFWDFFALEHLFICLGIFGLFLSYRLFLRISSDVKTMLKWW